MHDYYMLLLFYELLQTWVYFMIYITYQPYSGGMAKKHNIKPHLQYNMSHEINFCWWRHVQKLWRYYDAQKLWNYVCLFQNTFILGRSRVAFFADIIKILTFFIKRNFKDSKKVKRFRIYISKCSLYLYFLI